MSLRDFLARHNAPYSLDSSPFTPAGPPPYQSDEHPLGAAGAGAPPPFLLSLPSASGGAAGGLVIPPPLKNSDPGHAISPVDIRATADEGPLVRFVDDEMEVESQAGEVDEDRPLEERVMTAQVRQGQPLHGHQHQFQQQQQTAHLEYPRNLHHLDHHHNQHRLPSHHHFQQTQHLARPEHRPEHSDDARLAPGPPPPAAVARGAKRYSNAQPSRYCHICCRAKKRGDHMICGNVANGTCRKVICSKCFETQGWDWHAALAPGSGWTCPHCRNQCPQRAQCTAYMKNGSRRSKKNQQDDRERVSDMET